MERLTKIYDDFKINVNPIIVHIRKSAKNIKTDATRAKYANKLIELLNTLIIETQNVEASLNGAERKTVEENYKLIFIYVQKSFTKLKYKISGSESVFKTKTINYIQVELKGNETYEDDRESEDDLGLENTIQKLDMATFDVRLATSLVEPYDGSPENLESFIDSVEFLYTQTPENARDTMVSFLKTRLRGKARNLASNLTSLNDIKATLKAHCASKVSSETIHARLVNLRQKENSSKFCDEVQQLTDKLLAAYIAEGVSPEASTRLANQFGVESLIHGSRNPQTKLLLKAGNYKSLNEATTKMLKEDVATEEVTQILSMAGSRGRGGNYGRRGRGRRGGRVGRGGRGGFGNRGGFNGRGGNGGRGHFGRSSGNVRYTDAEHVPGNNDGPQEALGARQQQQHQQQQENQW